VTCCPSCGYSLTRDEPVERDGWRVEPTGAWYRGKHILTGPSDSATLHAIASAPRPVSTDALLNRLGSEALSNVVAVYVSRIRSRCSALGVPSPIQTVRSYGYRWRSPD
jgi:DNA-binding response OmpR family regulator